MDIFEAARGNHTEEIRRCMRDIDINSRDGRGSTPLIVAAYYNNMEATLMLLGAGANTELQDQMGNTALMGVCFKGHTQIGKLLLENGAEANKVNGNNAGALTFAVTFGHLELIALLLEYGADPQLKDYTGKNAIDHALIQENSKGYEMMVAAIIVTSKSQ